MASINDLATAAVSALTPATPPQPPPLNPSSDSMAEPAPTTAAVSSAGPAAAVVPTADAAPAATPATAPEPGSSVRGALVVLEGLDRSGKTTQVKLLEQRFVELGKKVKVMRFPDRSTPIGQMIDGYLRSQVEMEDHVIHLLFSANRWEAVKNIVALLNSGTTVLCDRYYHSGIVYSAAKQNPSLSLSWARAPEVGLPRPDLVLFLDLEEAQAKARGGWGGEVYEKGEMQRRVRELFWGLSLGKIGVSVGSSNAAASTPAKDTDGDVAMDGEKAADSIGVRSGPVAVPVGELLTGAEITFRQEEEDLQVIDASPSVEEVAEEIWKVVQPRVEGVERGEVGTSVRRVS